MTRVSHLIAYAVPVVVLAALGTIYWIAPQFYLTYVLEYRMREYQAVEFVTFGCAISGSVLLFGAAWREYKSGAADRGGFTIIAVVALATFFFAGEEVSWGQTYLHWNTPDAYRQFGGETNLHNTKWLAKGLASGFIAVIFFVLPALWTQRRTLCLPRAWSVVIAEGPVIFSMACAFIWKFYKNIYIAFVLTGDKQQDVFYVQFVDQINEQKEMLVAVSLLMYGLYRVRAVKRNTGKDVEHASRG